MNVHCIIAAKTAITQKVHFFANVILDTCWTLMEELAKLQVRRMPMAQW